MILSLQEDGILCVYETLEDVTCAVEVLDAEETLRTTFDDHAQQYTIEWIRPNYRSGLLFGLVGIADNGEYRLAPCGSPDPDGLLRCIQSAIEIEPADKRAMVQDLVHRLTNG